jgi:hypothetical protein
MGGMRIHVFRIRQAQDTYRRVLLLHFKFDRYCFSFKQGANSLYGQVKECFPSFCCTPHIEEENKLRAFENRVLREIFGPKREKMAQ